MVSLSRWFPSHPFAQPPANEFESAIAAESLEAAVTGQGATRPMRPAADPVRRATIAQIAVVSVEEGSNALALLHDDAAPTSLFKRITLPRNPRIADDELYELEGVDLIVMMAGDDQRLTKDHARWLQRLKPMGVPMLVLLPATPKQPAERERLDQFARYVNLPVIALTPENLNASRQTFVLTMLQIAPATAIALAAQLPSFRAPLVDHLLQVATERTLHADPADSLPVLQMRLVRQLCAAYGCNGHPFESHKAALETLIRTCDHYIQQWIQPLPMRDPARRTRFTHAVSTLLMGHATTVYMGATPPSVRHTLLPQLWRLYRASGQPVQA